MKKIILIIFLLIFTIVNSQIKDSICDLQNKNTKWKNKFEKLNSKVEKIEAIKAKFNDDTKYSEIQPLPLTKYSGQYKIEIGKIIVDERGNHCGCNTSFMLLYIKKKAEILNVIANPKWNNFIKNLNENNVSKIENVFDKSAEKIYGSFGKCGIVMIHTNERKLWRLLKKTSR